MAKISLWTAAAEKLLNDLMKNIFSLLLLPALLLILPTAAFGSLEWKKQTIDYRAAPGDAARCVQIRV